MDPEVTPRNAEDQNPLEDDVNAGNTNKYQIRLSVKNSPQECSVLGVNVMRRHHIVFDLEQLRIGFADASVRTIEIWNTTAIQILTRMRNHSHPRFYQYRSICE